jgi:hypothetical protein
VDGEVAGFERMAAEEVLRHVAFGSAPGFPCLYPADSDDDGQRAPLNAFKPNINLVVIDFLVRHGILTPETPGYLHIVAGLRRGECS